MKPIYITLIALALVPIAKFLLLYLARVGLIAVKRWMPQCKLKTLLLKGYGLL
jgi:hypothetical protein